MSLNQSLALNCHPIKGADPDLTAFTLFKTSEQRFEFKAITVSIGHQYFIFTEVLLMSSSSARERNETVN